MKLDNADLNRLAESAIVAARKAGELIAQTRPMHIQQKVGGDSLASQVLTEVDQQSQEIILKELLPTCAQYDLALLTEESEDDQLRLEKEYFWCIDPLDGTLPFIEAFPGYSVSIALVSRDGTPQLGVVFDPVEKTLYHALRGQGAFRNNQPWKIGHAYAPKLSLFADRSFKKQPRFAELMTELENIATDYGGLKTHMIGGAAMNACWTLENAPACYFKFPKCIGGGSLWDFAATACIAHEAGAIVTDIFGAPLDLNRPDSTFMNHRGILYATDDAIAQCIIGLYKRF